MAPSICFHKCLSQCQILKLKVSNASDQALVSRNELAATKAKRKMPAQDWEVVCLLSKQRAPWGNGARVPRPPFHFRPCSPPQALADTHLLLRELTPQGGASSPSSKDPGPASPESIPGKTRVREMRMGQRTPRCKRKDQLTLAFSHSPGEGTVSGPLLLQNFPTQCPPVCPGAKPGKAPLMATVHGPQP